VGGDGLGRGNHDDGGSGVRVLPNNLTMLVKQITRSKVVQRMINNVSRSRAAEFTAQLMASMDLTGSGKSRHDSMPSLRRTDTTSFASSLTSSLKHLSQSFSVAGNDTPPRKLRRMSTASSQNLLKNANERATALKMRRSTTIGN